MCAYTELGKSSNGSRIIIMGIFVHLEKKMIGPRVLNLKLGNYWPFPLSEKKKNKRKRWERWYKGYGW